MKNILITGGCGFIGRNLCNKLLQDPTVKIRIVDNLSVPGHEVFIKYLEKKIFNVEWTKRLTVFNQDIRNFDGMYKLFEGVTHVVHLAANTGVQPSILDPQFDCETNVIGTQNCLQASVEHNVEKFVFASSGAPLGNQIPPLHEEMIARPVSPYGASKLAGEAYLNAYYHSFGLNSAALRFSNVYGPGSNTKASVIAKFIKLILNDQPIEIYGDGSQTRDFIYVEDLVEAIVLSLDLDLPGSEIFQIATNLETSISDLIRLFQDKFEAHGIKLRGALQKELPKGDVARNYSDTDKARKLLNWQASTSLDKGLSHTIEYFINGAHFDVKNINFRR
jgi:UDP-glucose 4-epimerase